MMSGKLFTVKKYINILASFISKNMVPGVKNNPDEFHGTGVNVKNI